MTRGSGFLKGVLSQRFDMLGTVLLAAAVRAVYFFAHRDSLFNGSYRLDQEYYRTWGRFIAGGDLLGREVFEQGPLYAYLLGGFYRIFGTGDALLLVIQLALGTIASVLVYRAGLMLFGREPALLAAILAAIYGPFVYYECMVMKTFLAPLFTATALVAGLRYWESGKTRWLFLAGTFVGLLVLEREIHAILAIPLAAAVWLRPKGVSAPRGGRIAGLSALAIAMLLPVFPATTRNWAIAHEFTPVTAGGGEVFYIAHGPFATGYYAIPDFVRPFPKYEHEDFRSEARRRTGRYLTREESSRYWFKEGVRFVVSNPMRTLRLCLIKVAILFNDFEAPDSESYTVARRQIPLLQLLPSFGWIVGPAFLGIILAFRKWQHLFILPLGFVGAFILEIVLSYNFARFRLGVVPVLILLAARGLFGIHERWREKNWRGLVALGVAAAVPTMTAFLPPVNLSSSVRSFEEERMLTELKVKAVMRDRLPALEQARDAKPLHPGTHLAVGAVMQQLGRLPEEIASLREALRLDPWRADVRAKLGDELFDLGYRDEGVALLEEARMLRPENPKYLVTLGEMYARIAGAATTEDAVVAFRRRSLVVLREAIQREPGHEDARRLFYDLMSKERSEQPRK